MARNWSDAARSALDAYPWASPAEKANARAEAELVAFGDRVECDDLPLAVRRWLRRGTAYVWRGETLADATAAFERAIIGQALTASGGNLSAAARALGTTPRVVAYKARKRGLAAGAART